MSSDPPRYEVDKVRERYARRQNLPEKSLYNPLRPSVYMAQQEKERALIRWINTSGISPVEQRRVLEIGCGSGGNLLQFIKLGFSPANLLGNELLENRADQARHKLPSATQIIIGDAASLDLGKNSFDIILQSTVFSSILDDNFQQKLANNIWSMVKPGGGVLWYDFIYDNPKNQDVKGVSVKRIKQLFPSQDVKIWRLTLAPPINRLIIDKYPPLYNLLNSFTFLRTHTLCWIKK